MDTANDSTGETGPVCLLYIRAGTIELKKIIVSVIDYNQARQPATNKIK
jgi:hypothetical protein